MRGLVGPIRDTTMHVRALFLCLLAAPLAAQGTEWITNGGFTGTLVPWSLGGGYSVNPGLQSGWDTTGLGASDSFGVSAGLQANAPPTPPNWIEQQVLMIQGLTYELRADASGARPQAPLVTNAEIGTVWVEVNSVEVARFAFGSYLPNQIQRAQICGRFSPNTTGMVTLRIYFQRSYVGDPATPRINIDNVSVRDVVGPTHWIAGDRKIGTTVAFKTAGNPNAAFLGFLALGELNPPVPLPGTNGLLALDPVTATLWMFGSLNSNGLANVNVMLPNQPFLLTLPLYYQAASITGGTVDLGYHFGVVCTQ